MGLHHLHQVTQAPWYAARTQPSVERLQQREAVYGLANSNAPNHAHEHAVVRVLVLEWGQGPVHKGGCGVCGVGWRGVGSRAVHSSGRVRSRAVVTPVPSGSATNHMLHVPTQAPNQWGCILHQVLLCQHELHLGPLVCQGRQLWKETGIGHRDSRWNRVSPSLRYHLPPQRRAGMPWACVREGEG
jgi:hypothetical protein